MNKNEISFEGTKINKDAELLTYSFSRIFSGFENVGAVKGIFGKSTKRTLSRLRVLLFNSPIGGYMYIDEKEGVLCCNLDYLKKGDKRHIYLDVIHELVHIGQLMDGKELFNEQFDYTSRPTELEAYKVAVDEARRIGMDGEEIREYLKVEWVDDKEFSRFLKKLKVE